MHLSTLAILRLLRYILALTGTAGTALAVVTTIGVAGPGSAAHAPAHSSAPRAARAGAADAAQTGDPSADAAATASAAAAAAAAAAASTADTSAVGMSTGAASATHTRTAAAPAEGVATGQGSTAASVGAGGPITIGAVGTGYQPALAATGVPLGFHDYAFFSGKVPTADMITVSAANTPWSQVAAAGPGSALYDQIVTWAQTIKARGTRIMVAYNHEPEGHDRLALGTPADFIAAYRHVETIFDDQGATNVVWTWQMTDYAFRVAPSDPRYAPDWYPGDAYVDNVGADAYNWFTCGANATGKYNELKAIGDPVLAFARAHHKAASFPEFASHANADRAQWLANAHQYFIDNQDVVTAAYYFNRPPTVAANGDCQWALTTAPEYAQLRAMAQDTAHFRA